MTQAKIPKTKTLTEQQTHLLRPGDKLVLDVVAGYEKLRQSLDTGYLRIHGLNHGETYTFERRERSLSGWNIHVYEEVHNTSVPFQYYSVRPNLEWILRRRQIGSR